MSVPIRRYGEDEVLLVSNTTLISGRLKEEVQGRLAQAGRDHRDPYVSFSLFPEIAQAMLRVGQRRIAG